MQEHEFALEWMKDYEEYERALNSDASYAATLSRSMALVLEEFYENLHNVGVSAVSASGMDAFFEVGARFCCWRELWLGGRA